MPYTYVSGDLDRLILASNPDLAALKELYGEDADRTFVALANSLDPAAYPGMNPTMLAEVMMLAGVTGKADFIRVSNQLLQQTGNLTPDVPWSDMMEYATGFRSGQTIPADNNTALATFTTAIYGQGGDPLFKTLLQQYRVLGSLKAVTGGSIPTWMLLAGAALAGWFLLKKR